MLSVFMQMIEKTPFKSLTMMVWYPGYVRGAPDLMVFVMPPGLRPPTDDLYRGAYRVVFIETDRDRRDAEVAMAKPLVLDHNARMIKFPVDEINKRPSTALIGDEMFYTIVYPPSYATWPFLVVTAGRDGCSLGDKLARGRYAWEAFPTEGAAINFCSELGQRLRQLDPSFEFGFMSGEDQKRDS